jgi:adenylate cyclase
VSFKRQLSKGWVAGLAGAVLAATAGYALHEFTFGSGLTNLSYDLLTIVKAQRVPTNVVLVLMNEASHEKLGQRLNAPWNRALHAQLVDKLSAAGAKAIVFDIVFNDPTTPQADARFARALSQSKRVILAADHEYYADDRKRFKMPIDSLRDAAAGVGSTEVIPARDLIVREHTPGQPIEPISTLSWVTAQFLGAPVTSGTTPESALRWIQYYAPPNLLPSVSYEEALSTGPADLFRDKVVFVGAQIFTRFAGERKDEYKAPYSFLFRESPFISGVEIQTTAFLNLLRGDWWSRLPPQTERTLIIIFGALAGYLLMQARPWSATALAVVIGLAVLLISFLALLQGRVWFPWLILVTQIGLVWVVSVTVNSFRLYLERRLYEQTLALYLSPKLVKKFAQDKRFREPGAEKQMLTILFSDIANFTSISEGMDSDELAKLMNHYFQKAVTDCIHVTDGTVVKYIGDAIFAFWNAPDLQHDHAIRACEAALRFRDQSAQLVNGQPLITRIGLHTGVANVGNFGSTNRVDYTALGESINLASRMEGLNKYLGTQVLITGATRAEIGEKFSTRFVGKFRLKGFEKSVEVFEPLGREPAVEPPWLNLFYSALEAFVHRDFQAAQNRFADVLNLKPDDGPSAFYLHKIAEFHVMPPPESWAGEIELREK